VNPDGCRARSVKISEMRPSQSAFVGIVVAAGLLVGCGGDSDSGEAGSVPETVASTVSPVETTDTTDTTDTTETTTAATEPPASTEPPTGLAVGGSDTSTSTAPAPDAGECLVGDWVVTEEQMDAFYSGLMSTLEAPLTIDTVGSAPLSFAADGTYEWAPDFTLTVEVAGASGTGEVGGTITGDWTATEGVVTTSSDLNALVVSITVNGVVFDGADLANGLLNSSPINGVTYSCDGPAPVLDFKTADPSVTVPVTLTPA
jgi:hypothetical protein